MGFSNWLEMVSVGITATAIGIPLGAVLKELHWKLISTLGKQLRSATPDANGETAHVV